MDLAIKSPYRQQKRAFDLLRQCRTAAEKAGNESLMFDCLLDIGDTNELLTFGQRMLLEGQFDRALECFGQLRRDDLIYDCAEQALAAGHFDIACQAYHHVGNQRDLARCGSLAQSAGWYDVALQCFQSAGDAEQMIKFAKKQYERGPEGQQLAGIALQSVPGPVPDWFQVNPWDLPERARLLSRQQGEKDYYQSAIRAACEQEYDSEYRHLIAHYFSKAGLTSSECLGWGDVARQNGNLRVAAVAYRAAQAVDRLQAIGVQAAKEGRLVLLADCLHLHFRRLSITIVE